MSRNVLLHIVFFSKHRHGGGTSHAPDNLHWHVRRPSRDLPVPWQPLGWVFDGNFVLWGGLWKILLVFQVRRFLYKYKRRLARLPHESALIYVVGFSVWFRFASETNQSYVFYCSTCFRSITYYGTVDATPLACSRERQLPPRQVAALFAPAKQP